MNMMNMNPSVQKVRDARDELPKLGLRNFWYPAVLSNKVSQKPLAVKMLGEEIAIFRDGDKVYAFHDRCPHRGLPLSVGKRYFPGTLTCAYHGWTFSVDGNCVAALNEGPDSKVPSKVKVRTYPVEERVGVIWIYMGDDEPRQLEDTLPEELTDQHSIVDAQVASWNCNWLPATENLMDSHDLFVHRVSIFYLFLKLPAWVSVRATAASDGDAVDYRYDKLGPPQAEYPVIGKWPRQVWWRRASMPAPAAEDYVTARLQLPSVIRVGFSRLMYVRYVVPIDENHTRCFMFAARRVQGFRALGYKLYYRLWASWSLMHYFIDQDRVIFEKQDRSAPERLSITDAGMVMWRRIIARAARQEQVVEEVQARTTLS